MVNNGLLQEFLRHVKAKNRSKNTIKNLEQGLLRAEIVLKKPLENATIEDLKTYFESLKAKGLKLDEARQVDSRVGYNVNSLATTEAKFIQFYSFCFDETDDERYSTLIRRLKRFKPAREKKHINPQDILLPEDIKRLINVATLERDRCIVAVLFESGMRLGELLALELKDIHMDEVKQEVVFNIPDLEGCKTGARSVMCLEIYGYVQDWLKCNPSNKFIPMKPNGLRKVLERLFVLAKIDKPMNIHFFRHSAITHAASLGMSETDLSYRFWGCARSNMLSVYIHLNQQLQAQGYRNAKGLGNGNGTTIINPLSCRCVECGRLIQSGSLCKQCEENKKLRSEMDELKNYVLLWLRNAAPLELPKSIMNTEEGRKQYEYDVALMEKRKK